MYCCNFLFPLCPLSHFPNISRHVLNPCYRVFFNQHKISYLLGPGPTGTGTITFNPTFGSFTLLEPISYWVKVFRLFRLEWIFLVFRVWTQQVDVQHFIYGRASVFVMPCLQSKWQSSIGRCKRSDYHPQEDSTKFGYKTEIEYQSFHHPCISLATQ